MQTVVELKFAVGIKPAFANDGQPASMEWLKPVIRHAGKLYSANIVGGQFCIQTRFMHVIDVDANGLAEDGSQYKLLNRQ